VFHPDAGSEGSRAMRGASRNVTTPARSCSRTWWTGSSSSPPPTAW
jgi:hypothetical protein